MKTKKQTKQKKGISLIVLVITIIVMIILAAAVIISLSNNGIIEKSNETVNETNLKQAQTIATTIWAESQLTKDDPATIKNKIIAALGDSAANYDIQVDENGVTVKVKGEDKTAPTLTITTPDSKDAENPTIVNNATFRVRGTVVDSSGVKSLTINSTEVNVSEDGTWSTDITLVQNETTTIRVVATDIKGNVTTEVRYVIYIMLQAGLYQTGSNYTVLLKSWDTLISEGILKSDGQIVSGQEANLAGALVIPNTIASILTLKNCTALTGIQIPASVTTIGNSAFIGCTSLESVTFAEGSQLTAIGYNTFNSCAGLISIEIPASVTSVEEYAFYCCTSLASVIFAEGSQLTAIGKKAFEQCTGLTSIEIPVGVTTIGNSAFGGCTSLESVTFAEGSKLTTIEPYAFHQCAGLTSIEIPVGVTAIVNNAFGGCTSLESVTFAEGSQLTTIGINGFGSCVGLTSIEIPASVTTISGAAFASCNSLESVTFAEGSQLTTIESYAFQHCTELTSINFVGTVQEWNAIDKGTNWNYKVPATEVACSDGTVTLN